MKAIRVHAYGDARVLQYEDAPRPEPGDDEVLVRIVAAGVNPFDRKVRAGMFQESMPLSLPWTPGNDLSGIVEQVGAGVRDVRVGDEVFGQSDFKDHGTYAEYTVARPVNLLARPRSLDHVHAAAVPGAALTAWQALFGHTQAAGLALTAGRTVLILGATGGVGTFAVQFARWKGAHVIAPARRAEDATLLRTLGADTIVDLAGRGLDDVGEVDAVLDLVGGDLQPRAWPHIKPGGVMVSMVAPPSTAEAEARDVRALMMFSQTDTSQLTEIVDLIDAGVVKVIVSHIVPLAEAYRAHELLEAGGVRGKIVLTVAPRSA